MPDRPRELPRRFYKEAEAVALGDGFGVALDGRPLLTPLRARLAVPWRALAEDIAAEWRTQGERIERSAMPVTRLANAALDAVAHEHETTVGEIVKFAGSDLLFYRADGPEGLVERQAAAWDPLVRWAGERLGVRLVVAEGLIHVAQPDSAIEALRRDIATYGVYPLASVHMVTTLTGSAILALAVAAGRVTAGEAWQAAHIDEDWQIGRWGEDAEAAARRARRHRDFAAAARVLDIAREEGG